MARTIEEIHESMIADVQSSPVLGGVLTSTSKVSIWRMLLYVVASAIWIVETLLDEHEAEVDQKIASMKPRRPKWYQEIAKFYQHGRQLVEDEIYYDNTGLTEEEIEEERVVKFSAVDEVNNSLVLKIATESNGDLAPLPQDQEDGFKAYMHEVKDAGVRVIVKNLPADYFKLQIDIYYDPLVLNADGERLDGANDQPVQEAIDNYLKTLDFNGIYRNDKLIDVLQLVEGVELPHLVLAQAKYGNLAYVSIPVKYKPDAGYLRLYDLQNDLTINFIPYAI